MYWIRKYGFTFVMAGLLALGALAAADGIASRSLLLDEALFVRNVSKFPGGYFISMAPSAPLFYALSYAVSAAFGGASEWVFRLIPLLCALGVMALLSLHLTANFSRPVALVCALLAAFSVPLSHFSANAHPYTADVLCSAAMILAALKLIREFSGRTFAAWLAIAGVSVLFSFPALFTVVSCSAFLLLAEGVRKPGSRIKTMAPWLAGLGVYLALLLVLVFMKQSSDHSEYKYWSGCFPANRHPLVLARFAFARTEQALGYLFFNGKNGLIGLFLSVLGTAYFIRKRQVFAAALFWGPVLLALAASFFGKWPYGPLRTVLFLLPSFILLVAGGLEWIWQGASSRAAKAAAACAFALLLLPQAWVVKKAVVPARDSTEAVKSLSAAVKPEIREGDRFLVYYAAEVQFRFYFRQYLDRATFQPWSDRGNPEALEGFVRKEMEGKPGRFWLVFSHLEDGEDKIMISAAEKFGKIVSTHVFPGCGAALVEGENRHNTD
jgi:hypothetical protein